MQHIVRGQTSQRRELKESKSPTRTLRLFFVHIFKDGGKIPCTFLCPSSYAQGLCEELTNKAKEENIV